MTRRAIADAGGRCQVGVAGVCTGRATTGHHRLPRARGGAPEGGNCVVACRPCHRFITDNPAWAYAHGFTVRRPGPQPQGGARC